MSNKRKHEKTSRAQRRWSKLYGKPVETYRNVGYRQQGLAKYVSIDYLTAALHRRWIETVLSNTGQELRSLTPTVFREAITNLGLKRV